MAVILGARSPSSKERFVAPSREDYFDFLVRCYFGEGKNPLRLCVQRAYLDLNRTLHGFAGYKGAESLREKAHRDACTQLRALYRQDGFNRFTFGQAQKWLNMTLKYVFTLGETRVPGFQQHYRFAHIPIDNVFVEAALPHGGPDLPMSWSRLDDYAIYIDLQRQYRAIFSGSKPLAAEFRLWINNEKVN